MAKDTAKSRVTHVYAGYERLSTVISCYRLIRTADKRVLASLMNVSNNNHIIIPFEVLISVAGLKVASQQDVCNDLHMDYRTARTGLEDLLTMGYVSIVKRPRIIKVFGSYKTDTCYKITSQGLQALQQIIAA